MALGNALKVFGFVLEIDGVDQILIQDVKFPDVEIGKVEHGATNYNVKTAGGVTVGDAELQKIKAAPEGDSWAWEWATSAQDAFAGGGLTEDFKRDVIFKEMAPDGVTTINSWLWEGCWVMKISTSNYKRGAQDENVLETLTLSVDRVQKLV